MADSNTQLHWTEEQWNKVRQVVYEEARRARVAGNVLPLYGPLDPDARYVSKQLLKQLAGDSSAFWVDDTDTLKLATLRTLVHLRGAQVADPDLDSALIAFRRAANYLARREDEIIFNGDSGTEDEGDSAGSSSTHKPGLVESAGIPIAVPGGDRGEALVTAVSNAIAELEKSHHLGPFACLLGHQYFLAVQTPTDSMVLPQERILPFLQGGALLRTSVLGDEQGLVIALGGAPIDLVVATDISVSFLQVTEEARFIFRVYEKIALRIKEPKAIALLHAR